MGNSPLNELENVPEPVPSIVLLLLIVGELVELLQQTPFELIEAPPSLEILPPPIALVVVIDDIVFVYNTGIVAEFVMKLCILP